MGAIIDYHAFANCLHLREIHIPASVVEIDKDALEGYANVTVYGSTAVAKEFAESNGFKYYDLNAAGPESSMTEENPPVTLPFVSANNP